jgi:XapX domain-containing protein
MKTIIGLFVAFALGAVCRVFDIPVPSPPKLVGALLVLTITLGYLAADRVLSPPAAPSARPAGTTDRSPK